MERIRNAALTCFAAYGTAATSLRQIAEAAGVSIGLVQHHFGTKDGLVNAVDDHVLAILSADLAVVPPTRSTDPVGEFGQRVTALIAEHPAVIDYIVRALIEQTPAGGVIFDALVAMGEDRWNRHTDDGLTPPDLDLTWAALNPLLLVLGAMTFRAHLSRHLPEPFTTTTQLTRWEKAVNTLIRDGQLRIHPPPEQQP